MYPKKGLLLLGIFTTIITIVSCNKPKNVMPAAKTVADYIRQMVGTHKMVGQSDYRSPGLDTVIAISESWIIDSPGESSFRVKTPTFALAMYHLVAIDSSINRMKFYQESGTREYYVYYYYLADSIVYWGYNKTSMTTYEIMLHSEK